MTAMLQESTPCSRTRLGCPVLGIWDYLAPSSFSYGVTYGRKTFLRMVFGEQTPSLPVSVGIGGLWTSNSQGNGAGTSLTGAQDSRVDS